MLAIKLQRVGKKHQPSYRVVVAPARSKLGGPPIEDLGSYNLKIKQLTVDKERIAHWLSVGAKPSVTVHNLFVKHGAVAGKALPIKMNKPKAAAEVKPAEAPATAAPAA